MRFREVPNSRQRIYRKNLRIAAIRQTIAGTAARMLAAVLKNEKAPGEIVMEMVSIS